MKKFLTFFSIIFLITNSSNATGLFVGADFLNSYSKHKVKNYSSQGSSNGDTTTGNKMGFGVNAGARLDFLNLYGSAELFYDNLNVSSKRFASSNNTGDKLTVKDRYGAKLNAGFAIVPKVRPFVTLGFANVKYDIGGTTPSSAYTKSKLTPLYGIGLLIDLPLGITLKAAYDYQSYLRYSPNDAAKIRTHLGVARLGVIYNF